MTHNPSPGNNSGFIREVEMAQGKNLLEMDLLNSRVESVGPASGGANAPLRLRLSNGWIAYFKGFPSVNITLAMAYGHGDRIAPVFEAVAWRLAVWIGPEVASVVQPAVIRDLTAVPGVGQKGSLSLGGYGQADHGEVLDTEELVRRCAFFDCLIGQQDRHDGNYKYEPAQGRLALFDHGFAFGRPGDQCNNSIFVLTCQQRGWQDLAQWQIKALLGLTTSSDFGGVAPMLPDDRLSALETRAARMLRSGQILAFGDL